MKRLSVLSLCLVIALTACLPKTSGQTTQASQGDQNGVDAAGTIAAQTVAAAGQQPATTLEPVVQAVTATANQNANCRFGPGTMYDIIGVFDNGTSAPIIGRYDGSNGKWYKVELSDGTQCWVSDETVSISGDISTVAYLNAPATPTAKPKPSWVGTWGSYQTMGTNPLGNFTLNMVMNGEGQITFNFNPFGTGLYYATGTPSGDGTYMEGFAQKPGAGDRIRFRFYFVASNSNQFQGQWYIETNPTQNGDWCGSRNGAGLPSPCRR